MCMISVFIVAIRSSSYFFSCCGDPRHLHVLTHPCPTRRSSDLAVDQDLGDLGLDELGQRLARLLAERGLGLRLLHQQRALADRGSEEHTSELQSLMRISYAVFCLKKTKIKKQCITTSKNPTHTS